MAKKDPSDNDKIHENEKYIDLASTARIVQILFGIAIFMRLFDLSVGLATVAVPQIINGELHQMLIPFLVIGTPLASLIAGLSLLIWMGRAYTNLKFLNVKMLGKKSVRCYWGWFIPLANVVIPHETMQDIWKASDPSVTDPKKWLLQNNSLLISTWWFSFILSGVLGILSNLQRDADPMIQFILGIALDLAYSVTAIQLILLVGKIGPRQESKKRILEAPDTVSI